jgi:uncharacterized RDD family membrane protein YckC
MVAALLDHLIIALIMSAIALLGLSLGSTTVGATAISIIIGGPLLLLALYFTIFEIWWNGQTPGKRAAGLRVMRDDGTPASALDLVIRNTVRLVDFLPYLYFVGGIVSFFQQHGKRLGDLAAGTVVVKLRESALPDAAQPAPEVSEPAEGVAPSARAAVLSLTPDELASIRRFLDRRFELAPELRSRIASEVFSAVASRLPPEARAIGEEKPEALLAAIAQAHAQMGERF